MAAKVSKDQILVAVVLLLVLGGVALVVMEGALRMVIMAVAAIGLLACVWWLGANRSAKGTGSSGEGS